MSQIKWYNKCLIFLLCLPAAMAAQADFSGGKYEHKSLHTIERESIAGARYHKRGEYKKAFEKLSESARWGMKQAQYLLGVMYLKGQYVDQSINVGMAWLGVANEIDIKEWKNLYDGVFEMLDVAQQNQIEKKIAVYIDRFGLKTHNLICEKRTSIRSRKVQIHCDFRSDRVSPLFEIEDESE